jgi:hypothetical protein
MAIIRRFPLFAIILISLLSEPVYAQNLNGLNIAELERDSTLNFVSGKSH